MAFLGNVGSTSRRKWSGGLKPKTSISQNISNKVKELEAEINRLTHRYYKPGQKKDPKIAILRKKLIELKKRREWLKRKERRKRRRSVIRRYMPSLRRLREAKTREERITAMRPPIILRPMRPPIRRKRPMRPPSITPESISTIMPIEPKPVWGKGLLVSRMLGDKIKRLQAEINRLTHRYYKPGQKKDPKIVILRKELAALREQIAFREQVSRPPSIMPVPMRPPSIMPAVAPTEPTEVKAGFLNTIKDLPLKYIIPVGLVSALLLLRRR